MLSPIMAYAGSNDAKMNFVGGAVFAKCGLFCPQNYIFALNFKSIADRGLILVAIPPKWLVVVPMMHIKF